MSFVRRLVNVRKRHATTKEDIEALIPRVEHLAAITKEVCENRIKEYASRARTTN